MQVQPAAAKTTRPTTATGAAVPAPAPRPVTALPGFATPDWVKDAVFYQVFPDRFANGDRSNDPPGTRPWGSAPTNAGLMGGDLAGVTSHLDYLTRLGVNALYLNPVFGSPSNHGYNTTDYEHVSPRLGGDPAFAKMVDAAHGKGMKVMLDGVFNHTSHEHPWFQDVREKGPESPHAAKYDVKRWPIRYERDANGVLRSPDYASWWNYAELPELRTDRAEVRDYFLTGPNSIVKRWLRDGKVDGWRMDVADEVEHDFWKQARREVKSTNPDAYLLAENWHDASDYLKGDEFDAAMNYRYFQQPAVSFFAKKEISTDEFVQRLQSPYPTEAKQAMFNVLGSHDTPRFVTEAGGDWYRMRPAAIFQMTYVGAPVIYYGDEIGMEGGKDPDCRRAFPWQVVEPGRGAGQAGTTEGSGGKAGATERGTGSRSRAGDGHATKLLDLYRTLTSARASEPALRRGDFNVLATHNGDRTLSFRRSLPNDPRDVLVALNNDVTGHEVTIPVRDIATDGTAFTDRIGGGRFVVRDGHVTLPHLEGNFGAVLVREPAPAAASSGGSSPGV